MQFIDGRTLAQVIADLRGATADRKQKSGAAGPPACDPLMDTALRARQSTVNVRPVLTFGAEASARAPAFFRMAARLGIQAAEAL
jgi:hypothetical protein